MKHKIIFLPDEEIIFSKHNDNILSVANSHGINIASTCGGEGTCGKCKVIIKSGKYNFKSSHFISQKEKEQGYVLACKTDIIDDLIIEIPAESRIEKISALKDEFFTPAESIEKSPSRPEEKIFTFSPISQKIFLKIDKPTLFDNIADWERITRCIYNKKPELINSHLNISLDLLKKLSKLLRDSNWEVTVTLTENNNLWEIIDIQVNNTAKNNFGIAIDIGTTTVVTFLVNLNTGEILNSKATHNQQMSFGDDVITRIMYSEKREGLEKLNSAICNTINELISALTLDEKISKDDITSASIAGNTTMIHLFLDIPPNFIRREPYIPVVNFPPNIKAKDIKLNINPEAPVFCLSGVASYVGGDITAGVLACGMDNFSTISVLIDLGTNGEIVLGNKEWLLTSACSAGPAFEGVGIKYGIRAMDGAIQKIEIHNNILNYTTIGDKKPKGICGSGLIDIIAELFKNGIIDKAGKFVKEKTNRIRKNENDEYEFLIVEKNKTQINQDIVITESDILNLIHSKGAVFLGLKVLLEHAGLNFDNISHIYVAGGFGTYLDIEKAIIIGLLPDIPRDRFSFIGNSSITGAKMCLISKQAREKVKTIAQKMTYIELSTEPKFMNEYTSTLFLPHTDINLFPSVKKYY